eukprot:2967510-Ditylum_brightwellii.AAC.1
MRFELFFKENITSWGDYQADMKAANVSSKEHIVNVEATKAAATKIAKILDAKYQKKHKELFEGTLGTWKNFQYNIKLQECECCIKQTGQNEEHPPL